MENSKQYYFKESKKQTLMFIAYFLIVISTLCLGSLLFFFIEHCYDVVQPKLANNEKALQSICNVTKILNKTENDIALKVIEKICIDTKHNHERIECVLNRYTFGKWFDFTTSVSFTTGFGRVVPLSRLGKIATIIYSVPSIAFCMTLYVTAGKMLTAYGTLSILLVEEKILKRKVVSELAWKVLLMNITMAIILCFLFSFPSKYATTGNPDLLDSFYFGFMTITTVGFGDYNYNSEFISRRLHMFFIHAVMFCICTGSIASIIGSLNNIFTRKKLKTVEQEESTTTDETIPKDEQQTIINKNSESTQTASTDINKITNSTITTIDANDRDAGSSSQNTTYNLVEQAIIINKNFDSSNENIYYRKVNGPNGCEYLI